MKRIAELSQEDRLYLWGVLESALYFAEEMEANPDEGLIPDLREAIKRVSQNASP